MPVILSALRSKPSRNSIPPVRIMRQTMWATPIPDITSTKLSTPKSEERQGFISRAEERGNESLGDVVEYCEESEIPYSPEISRFVLRVFFFNH